MMLYQPHLALIQVEGYTRGHHRPEHSRSAASLLVVGRVYNSCCGATTFVDRTSVRTSSRSFPERGGSWFAAHTVVGYVSVSGTNNYP
jgi:hypothetical protein